MKHYICIEGNIGVGKSTLAQRISKELGYAFLSEEFEENYLLPLFYKEPSKFAFALEFSFLLDRFRQLCSWKEKLNNELVVSDYYFEKCMYFAQINLNDNDYKLFETQFNLLNAQTVEPDLLVILKLSTALLEENIKKRNRSYEMQIDSSYLEKLNAIYSNKSKSIKNTPIVTFVLNNNDGETYNRIYFELRSIIKSGLPSKNLEIYV